MTSVAGAVVRAIIEDAERRAMDGLSVERVDAIRVAERLRERAAVVRWLRMLNSEHPDQAQRLLADRLSYGFSNAIERGEHVK